MIQILTEISNRGNVDHLGDGEFAVWSTESMIPMPPSEICKSGSVAEFSINGDLTFFGIFLAASISKLFAICHTNSYEYYCSFGSGISGFMVEKRINIY